MARTYRQLTLEERCTIARLHEDGQSIRQIATIMGRAASSISRELKRNSGTQIGYRPAHADALCWARRWHGSRMERHPALRDFVLHRLSWGWSPEQIAGRMARDRAPIRVSYESIYRFIDAQIRRTQDYSWRHYLPQGKSKRGWRRRPHHPIAHIKHRVPIHQRDPAVEKRKQLGHWETDLFHPRKQGAAILVSVERASRFILLAKQAGKHAEAVAGQLQQWFDAMPPHRRQTLTMDNGPEFFLHHRLHPLAIKTYFCNPHSPWQKGSVENMNGRIRRFIPRGTDPDTFDDHDLQALAARLNATPRKCLGFKTPAEVWSLPQPLHFKCESTSPPARG
ncbi:MAG: IS30 family transposase [bacterium]